MPINGEFAEDFAQDAREFVRVSGTYADDDLGMLGECIDYEVAVFGHCVETGFGIELWAEESGDVFFEPGFLAMFAFGIGLIGARIGCYCGARCVNADFGGDFAIDRESVDGFIGMGDEYGKFSNGKVRQVWRGVVCNLFLGYGEGQIHVHAGEQAICPGTGCDDEFAA